MMQLPTIAQLSSSDTEDDEAEVEVFLPSKQLGSTAVDLDTLISAAEGLIDINDLSAQGAVACRFFSSAVLSLCVAFRLRACLQ
jgi:hypothetical protein